MRKLFLFSFLFLFSIIYSVNFVSASATQFFPLPEVTVNYRELYTFRPNYYFAGYDNLGIAIQFTDEDTGQSKFLNFNGVRYFSNSKYTIQIYSNGNIQILAKNQRINKKKFIIYASSSPASSQLAKTLVYNVVDIPDEDEGQGDSAPISPVRLDHPTNVVTNNLSDVQIVWNDYYSNYDCVRLHIVDDLDGSIDDTITKCITQGQTNYTYPDMNLSMIGFNDGVETRITATQNNQHIYVFTTVYKGIQVTSGLTDSFYIDTSLFYLQFVDNFYRIPLKLYSYAQVNDLDGNDYLCQGGIQMNTCRAHSINNISFNNFFASYSSLNISVYGGNITTSNRSQILNSSRNFIEIEENFGGSRFNKFEAYWNNGDPYMIFPDNGDDNSDLTYRFFITARNVNTTGSVVSSSINNFTYIRYNANDYGVPYAWDFWGRNDIDFEYKKNEGRFYTVSEFFDNYEMLGVEFGNNGSVFWINRTSGQSISSSNTAKNYTWEFSNELTSAGDGAFILKLYSGSTSFPLEFIEFVANDSSGRTLSLATFFNVSGEEGDEVTQQQTEEDTENANLKRSNNPLSILTGVFSGLFPNADSLSARARYSFVLITMLLIDIAVLCLMVWTGGVQFAPYVIVLLNVGLVFFFVSISYIPLLLVVMAGIVLFALLIYKFRGGGG